MNDKFGERKEILIKIIQNYLIPLLDRNVHALVKRSPQEENIQRAERILAEEYVKRGKTPWLVLLILIPIFFADVRFGIHPQIYGIAAVALGTMVLLVFTSISGRGLIALESEQSHGATLGGSISFNESRARQMAANTVITNISLGWMAFGFILQIVALLWFS